MVLAYVIRAYNFENALFVQQISTLCKRKLKE